MWFQANYDNPAARALLANSITLTPGTVTVDILEDGTYSVHALTEGAKAGLLDGTMQGKVARLFGETIDFRVLDVEEAEGSTEDGSPDRNYFYRKERIEAHMTIFYTAILLAITGVVLLMLFFMIRKNGVYDKLNAMFVMNTNIVFLILVRGLIDGRIDMYIDIALSYSILGFVTTVILAKFIGGRR